MLCDALLWISDSRASGLHEHTVSTFDDAGKRENMIHPILNRLLTFDSSTFLIIPR
jgi:hypothetical protein